MCLFGRQNETNRRPSDIVCSTLTVGGPLCQAGPICTAFHSLSETFSSLRVSIGMAGAAALLVAVLEYYIML